MRTNQYFTFVPPPQQTFNDTRAALLITQPLWRGGGTTADIARAEATVAAGRAQLSSVEQARLLDAAQAYLDVFRDQNIVELNRRLEQVLSVNRDNVQSTFNAGCRDRNRCGTGQCASFGRGRRTSGCAKRICQFKRYIQQGCRQAAATAFDTYRHRRIAGRAGPGP